MDRTKEISQKYHSILDGLNATVADAETKLESARQKYNDAIAAEREAVQNADEKQYLIAKKNQHESAGAIEMYEKRLRYIRNQPLITDDEYKQVITEIQNEYAETQKVAKSKLLDLAEEMNAVSEDLQKDAEYAEEVINFLFLNIRRQINGVPTSQVSPALIPRLPHDSTIIYGKTPMSNSFYDRKKGGE